MTSAALMVVVLGAVTLALAVDLAAAIGWIRRRCVSALAVFAGWSNLVR